MATANQIYAIVNSVATQGLGSTAVTVTDTGSLVSLGEQVFSSDLNVDAFYNALTDRIGRTIVAIREYKAKMRGNMRDSMDWGIIMQKISFKRSTAVENPTWVGDTQASPFDVESTIEVKQKLFSKLATWSHEEKIPDWQMRTAFLSAEKMNAFISGIMMSMQNSMEQELERVSALATNTNIAGCLLSDNDNMKRDLLFEFNYKHGYVNAQNQTVSGQTPLTIDTALENVDFLKYASKQINDTMHNISTMSRIFNAENMERFTDSDHVVLEVLNQFASATNVYLQSDTFHNELTKLPNYEVVTYWQGSGESFDIADTSKIAIKNIELATGTNTTGEVERTGIIAFLHDRESCGSTMYDRRMRSIYNPRSEVNIYMEKATTGYAVDMSENAIVFYMGNPVS